MNAPVRLRTSRGTVKRIAQSWQLYVLILPAIVYIFLFCYQPMYGVQIAFKDFRINKGILGSPWVGLKHFIRFVQYPDFWNIMRNTAVISLYSFVTFPISIIFALLLNEIANERYKKTVQMVTYMPHFISMVVICQMIEIFLGRTNGFVNNLLELLGRERIPFLESGKYFASVYVWSDVWQEMGWGAIIYIAALASVPPELIEAARIDGANRMQIIWHVNIPTIMPTVIIMLILRCGGILAVGFEKTYLLQNALNIDASQVISTYTYKIGLLNAEYSYSSAVGLFNTVINVGFLVIVNLIAKRFSEISIW